jgi:hypothetical protein
MEEEVGRLINQRLRRQLVYPFLEIEYRNKSDKFERQKGETDMADVVEIAEDGRLLSIKEVSEIYLPKNPKNSEENTDTTF